MEVRPILDVMLVENKVVDFERNQRVLGVFCKLDLEKVHYHANNKFLDSIMFHIRFGEKRRKWIYFGISSVKLFMFVNSDSCGFLDVRVVQCCLLLLL